jgi:hypothetical protein
MLARRATLVLTLAAGLAAGCGEEKPPPVAASCTGEAAVVVQALRTAPGSVALPDGATISECVRRSRTDAALQNVGVTLAGAAEDLEARALNGDEQAALQLGYLVGAARVGARTNSGVSAELVHRLERSAGFDGGSTVDAALQRGLVAGERRG